MIALYLKACMETHVKYIKRAKETVMCRKSPAVSLYAAFRPSWNGQQGFGAGACHVKDRIQKPIWITE